ncbi:MAG: bifunctional riboflavin kinase/FMN adenylyltransferase [Candidatus Limnocylindria bacterium]
MSLGLPTIGPAVVTLGVFDGVHIGHRHVVAATSRAALERGARSVALVFDPPPIEIIQRGVTIRRLLPLDLVLDRLGEAGIDHAVRVEFDPTLQMMSPEDFLEAVGLEIELSGVAMTPSSAFGHQRAGTLERVSEIGVARGFEAIRVEALTVDGEPVSSSRVRAALAGGDIDAATHLLGAAPLLRGIVVGGDHRGRGLGFPTANLAFDYAAALPALGIYLGRVAVPERAVGPGHPALVSVGVRPTFGDDGRVLVEVYLLDWDGDLYDATLDVELDARLREERRFESIEALVNQMQADEAEARRSLR